MTPALRLARHFARHPGRLWKTVRFWNTRHRSPEQHVFLCGCPRSGTTLLKSLLVAHPELTGTNRESTGLFTFQDVCEFQLGELADSEIHQLLSRTRNLIEFYDAIAAELRSRVGAEVFVDKLQPRRYRLAYVLRHFPHARVINIVRDGRDCYCSARKHPHVVQNSSLARFARYWREMVETPARLIPEGRLMTVPYCDLVRCPTNVVPEIMQFLGREFLPSQVDVSAYSATTAIRKLEVHRNLANPINDSSVGRWRHELSPAENDQFCAIAGPSLTRYGYPLK